jgi:hypothetical protein
MSDNDTTNGIVKIISRVFSTFSDLLRSVLGLISGGTTPSKGDLKKITSDWKELNSQITGNTSGLPSGNNSSDSTHKLTKRDEMSDAKQKWDNLKGKDSMTDPKSFGIVDNKNSKKGEKTISY